MNYRPSDLLRGAAIPDAVLQALPKTDLHADLAGSLRPGTLAELAAAAGVALPDDVRRAEPADIAACLQSAGHLTRAARELAEDSLNAGVRVLEARVCPLRHGAGGLDAEAVVTAVADGLAAAAGDQLFAGVLVTGDRADEPAANMQLARLAVARRDHGVVGFAMAGPEKGYPVDDHREAFWHARNNNLPATCDAGHADGAASIQAAIHRCGVVRVGHAGRLAEDQALLDFVNDHRIAVEICFSYAVADGGFAEPGAHPLRRYHEAGLRVSLGSGSSLHDDTDMVRELRRAVDTFDFTLLELEDMLLSGFKSAFIGEQLARTLIVEALTGFTAVRDRFGLDDLVIADGRG